MRGQCKTGLMLDKARLEAAR